jgi:hypothetical protein
MESVSELSCKNCDERRTSIQRNYLTRTHHSTMLLDFLGESVCRLQWILLVILLIQYFNSICDCHYLLHQAVVDPHESSCRNIYDNADNSSFFHMTGLTRRAFRLLLEYLFDADNIVPRCRHGRPCSLGPDRYLGLLLFNLESKMHYKHLCFIFGITPSVCSREINWMLGKTVRLLKDHPFAKVKFPNNAKMREYTDIIQARELLVDEVIGFMDGVSFLIKCTSKCMQQNAFYCGYDCDTMVNNVFAYGPDLRFFCSS